MPWPRRIRITRGQGSLNRFEVIIWAEDLSFSELSPESLCTLLQDRNASTNSRCRLTPAKETKVCPVCDTPIDANARVCPSCQTDLTLFDFFFQAEDGIRDLIVTGVQTCALPI